MAHEVSGSVSEADVVPAELPAHLSIVERFAASFFAAWYRVRCETCPWCQMARTETEAFEAADHHYDDEARSAAFLQECQEVYA